MPVGSGVRLVAVIGSVAAPIPSGAYPGQHHGDAYGARGAPADPWLHGRCARRYRTSFRDRFPSGRCRAMNIVICSLRLLDQTIAAHKPSHVIALLAPEADAPHCAGIADARRLVLKFNDIIS